LFKTPGDEFEEEYLIFGGKFIPSSMVGDHSSGRRGRS
jgi:hypothetical protein